MDLVWPIPTQWTQYEFQLNDFGLAHPGLMDSVWLSLPDELNPAHPCPMNPTHPNLMDLVRRPIFNSIDSVRPIPTKWTQSNLSQLNRLDPTNPNSNDSIQLVSTRWTWSDPSQGHGYEKKIFHHIFPVLESLLPSTMFLSLKILKQYQILLCPVN